MTDFPVEEFERRTRELLHLTAIGQCLNYRRMKPHNVIEPVDVEALAIMKNELYPLIQKRAGTLLDDLYQYPAEMLGYGTEKAKSFCFAGNKLDLRTPTFGVVNHFDDSTAMLLVAPWIVKDIAYALRNLGITEGFPVLGELKSASKPSEFFVSQVAWFQAHHNDEKLKELGQQMLEMEKVLDPTNPLSWISGVHPGYLKRVFEILGKILIGDLPASTKNCFVGIAKTLINGRGLCYRTNENGINEIESANGNWLPMRLTDAPHFAHVANMIKNIYWQITNEEVWWSEALLELDCDLSRFK